LLIVMPAARLEIIEAQGWYEKEAIGLGALFRAEVDRQALRIIANPLQFPLMLADIRRAPQSTRVPDEMKRFIAWFNDTAPSGKTPLPALTRAGIVHLYFVCIHPFEDGNGRIGRALAEKSLAQNLGQPSLIALAYTIERQAQGLLRGAGAQQQEKRDQRLADVFRQHRARSAEQHDQTRGFLHCEGEALRAVALATQRTAGESDRPHVP
jgi:Fic family protein